MRARLFNARAIRNALFFLFSFLLLISSRAVYCKSSKESLTKNSLIPVALPKYQADLLAADLPIVDALSVSGASSNGGVWLAGKRALWRWDVSRNVLQRVVLIWDSPLSSLSNDEGDLNTPADQSLDFSRVKEPERLLKLGFDGQYVFAASSFHIFQIASVEKGYRETKVFRYDLGGSKEHPCFGFFGTGNSFWWLGTRRALRIDRENRKLLAAPVSLNLLPTDLAALVADQGAVMQIRDRVLTRTPLGSPEASATRLESFSLAPKGLFVEHSSHELFLYTARTVLRYSGDGTRLQTIPVENHRALKTAFFGESVHGYLFDDGLLEVYDLGVKRTASFQFETAGVSMNHINSIVVLGSYDKDLSVVLYGRDMPRAFKLDTAAVAKSSPMFSKPQKMKRDE